MRWTAADVREPLLSDDLAAASKMPASALSRNPADADIDKHSPMAISSGVCVVVKGGLARPGGSI
jgi:hypothetical protein